MDLLTVIPESALLVIVRTVAASLGMKPKEAHDKNSLKKLLTEHPFKLAAVYVESTEDIHAAMSGLEAIALCRQRQPACDILILHIDRDTVEMLNTGAKDAVNVKPNKHINLDALLRHRLDLWKGIADWSDPRKEWTAQRDGFEVRVLRVQISTASGVVDQRKIERCRAGDHSSLPSALPVEASRILCALEQEAIEFCEANPLPKTAS